MPHPIENIMQTSMEQLKNMVDVNTVIGDPVLAGEDAVILPISKVSLGFVSGGGEYGEKKNESPVKRSGDMLDGEAGRYPFAGAAMAGMSLTPMGFLYAHGERVRLLPAGYASPLDRVIDAAPQVIQAAERLIRETAVSKEETGGAADAPEA